MGVNRRSYSGRVSSSYDYNPPASTPPEGNPDPTRYKILRHHEQGAYLLVEIQYPDCKNYEGKKVLLYKDCTYAILTKFKELDPHFSDALKGIYPIARFIPNKDGWEMGLRLIEASAHTYTIQPKGHLER